MNIAAIANFGVCLGTRMRFALRRTISPSQTMHRNPSESDAVNNRAVSKASQLTAIWHINPQNGRVECHWTKDPEEIAAHQSLPVLERFGLILAASQQNRTSNRVH
ncbi:hypothetical protein OIV19_08330 [Brucella sp. HL-2]|nr:hypothetical protein [Brucella sp. HL-2]MCV9907620.1 hypothetical protein [Brucella sp. HL-2]